MSTTTQCIENIIGLAPEGACQCTTYPGDANASLSGVYMSNLLETGTFAALANCDNGDDFWQGMRNARAYASQYVATDLFARLRQRAKPARMQFNGAIGRITTRSLHTGHTTNLGVRMYMAGVVGAEAKLTSIGAYFEGDGVITVTIQNQFGTVMGEFEIATEAGKHKISELETPLVLPMRDAYVPNYEYFITYEYDANNRPYKNDADCGCGAFKPRYNTSQPSFATTTPAGQGWAQWCMVGGFTGDIANVIATECGTLPVTSDLNMYGLTLGIQFKCGEQMMLCGHDWDFNNPMDVTLALALNYRAVAFAVDYLLRTPEFNEGTLINREILDAARVEYLSEYEKLMPYVAQEYPVEETDCWVCIVSPFIAKIQR